MRAHRPPSDATLDYGHRLAEALLGVDALYRAESGDATGLAVLNLDTDGRLTPAGYADYGDAREAFEALEADAAALPEADRRRYYAQTCRSTLAFIAWRDGGLPFEDQLGRFLHVPAAPVADATIDALTDELHGLLGRLGHHGDARARCAAWEERVRVAPQAVPEILEGYLDEAWTRTEERLLEIPADRSDGMRVRTVTGEAYNARCDYAVRTIDLNVDPVLTRPGLKHLAVHEGCPGHYVQFKLRETLPLAGEAADDVLLSVVNTASSSVFEGIADAGLEMLGWIEGDDDRVQSVLNRHRAAIGTAAAWRLHAEGRPREEVTQWLRGRALAGGDGWVENRMAFIAAPPRAVLIWSYWWGEPSVATAWRRVSEARRPAFLRFLHGRMHSTETVGMFDA